MTWSFVDSFDQEIFKIEDQILKFNYSSLADYERQNKHGRTQVFIRH